jgi:serine/threonine-protein kinase
MGLGGVLSAMSPMDDGSNEDLAVLGTIVGSYEYMAPEQAQDARAADHRSDIYSLGCTLYHCLSGRPPFVDADPLQVTMRHAQEPPPPIRSLAPKVPAELEEAINTMLAKSPKDRFQSMEDVARALEQFADTPLVDSRRSKKVLEEYLTWLGET